MPKIRTAQAVKAKIGAAKKSKQSSKKNVKPPSSSASDTAFVEYLGFNFALILYPKVCAAKLELNPYFKNEFLATIKDFIEKKLNRKLRSITISPLHQPEETVNGNELKPHYHLLIKMQRRTRLSSLLNCMNRFEFFEIDNKKYKTNRLIGFTKIQSVSSFQSYYNYLTHNLEPDKEQWEVARPLTIPNSEGFVYEARTNEDSYETDRELNMRKLLKIEEFIDKWQPINLADFLIMIKNSDLPASAQMEIRLLCKSNDRWIREYIKESTFLRNQKRETAFSNMAFRSKNKGEL